MASPSSVLLRYWRWPVLVRLPDEEEETPRPAVLVRALDDGRVAVPERVVCAASRGAKSAKAVKKHSAKERGGFSNMTGYLEEVFN
jgi:hypothetical protein